MKKIKIFLPLLAFLFAVDAAFETSVVKESAVTYYYKNGSICTACSQAPAEAEECLPDNKGVVCKCVSPSMVDAGIDPMANDCQLVKRPE